MKPPFATTFRIRGYEVDDSRTSPLSVILSALEQVRWAWMGDPGWKLKEGMQSGFFFVVYRQYLELTERPRFGDQLTITGAVQTVGYSRLTLQHQLLIDDRVIGRALVMGVWLGPNRRPARLPETTRRLGRAQAEQTPALSALPPLSAPTKGDPSSFLDPPRRLFIPESEPLVAQPDFERQGAMEFTVRASDCDVFAHVNASAWLAYCTDVLRAEGIDGLPNRALVNYHQEAVLNDLLTVDWRREDTGTQFRIHRDGQPLCTAVVGHTAESVERQMLQSPHISIR